MIVALDIETQTPIPPDKSLKDLRVSVAGVWKDGKAVIFEEHELSQLFAILDEAQLIVGHNLFGFDYKVLQRYASFDVAAKYREKTVDTLQILLQKTDRLISLNDLALRNLGRTKSGNGIDAPKLYQEGRFEELRAYLADDLHIMHDLYEHMRTHKKLKYGHITYKEAVEREIDLE